MAGTGVSEVKKFFEIESAAQMLSEWKMLSDDDKFHLKSGILDGTLDYDPASHAPSE